MSGEIRRSRFYVAGTRDGVAEIHAAGLFSLLWNDFLSLFLSFWLLQTWHIWMRGGSAGQWGAPPPTRSSICTLRRSVKWSRRRGCSGASQMNAFSVLAVLVNKVRVRLGKISQGDFWRSEVRAPSLWGSSRSRSPLCDASAAPVWRRC